MSQNVEWDELHDATLKTIIVTWQQGTVQVNLVTELAPIVSIYAEGLMQLIVPYQLPWGPSVSINNVYLTESPTKEKQRLEIEMQSGDIILIEATLFTLYAGK